MPTVLTRLLASLGIVFAGIPAHGPLLDPASGGCPPGMQHVSGDAWDASTDFGEALQDMTCSSWISRDFPARCRQFDPPAWSSTRDSHLRRKHLDFCIDRYEWPNREGSDPEVMYTYYDAVRECMAVGKRLCDEEEWTFACEGEEGLPYPYGYSRDSESCVIDRPWIEPDYSRMFSPARPEVQEAELARLWQGVPSGSMPKCLSTTGVYDMTGNVDEWTTSTRRTGYRSILKGGYWGPVRARCRPSTRNHNEWHRNYQTGFRCCVSLFQSNETQEY